MAAGGAMIIMLVIWGVICLAGVAGTAFWIWMLVDCVTKEPAEGNDKVVWIIIIALTHWIGALIYFLVRRPQRLKLYGV